jgi:hypothetical protein
MAPQLLPAPADDHHHPDEEGVVDRLVGAGIVDLGEGDEDGAADAHQHRAEHEDLELARVTFLPIEAAAMWLSRMARIMRPQGPP